MRTPWVDNCSPPSREEMDATFLNACKRFFRRLRDLLEAYFSCPSTAEEEDRQRALLTHARKSQKDDDLFYPTTASSLPLSWRRKKGKIDGIYNRLVAYFKKVWFIEAWVGACSPLYLPQASQTRA